MSGNYRKPPVAHQFKKGKSGNPRGRPPKKQSQFGLGTLGGGIADRLAVMALAEATRPVTVREGEKTSEMPAMQALLRTMFRAAAQGDIRAGRQLMELIAQAESARSANAVEMLQFAATYKERYGQVFEQHEREGLEPPEIYPHPDDFVIDEITGVVTIDGPNNKDEAGARKAFREDAIQSLPRYFKVEAALKKQPKNKLLKKQFEDLRAYHDFLERDAARNARHEALRASRRALAKSETDDKSDQ